MEETNMSKLSKAVSEMNQVNSLRLDETVKNFMNGDSYVVNPLDTLKMITASSIFGEPSYYRDGKRSGKYRVDSLVREFSILPKEYEGLNTETIMENAIDKALDYDFNATIEWAATLRHDYFMRLNPQVIMVRAAVHPKRKEFSSEYPGKFDEINQKVMSRADEPMSQMSYYLYTNKGKKNNIPSIIKRSWSKKISGIGKYQMAKYKNHEIGMINAVRLCHAHSNVIDELMQTGTIEVEENDKTWENLRSAGKSWKEIFNTINMGHMALLRNIRGVFTEVEDIEFCKKYMQKIKDTVVGSKQFPFRYYSALMAVKSSRCNHQPIIIDALEECMDIALANYPKLKGKTMCLSDNSGSAWGAFNSEYGTVTVANIDNLSSVITAACSDEGYVGKFGDRLAVSPVSKRAGVLNQAEAISKFGSRDVGGSTEGGIWEFFKNAIDNNEHWDNIFIYSDQQAGHGGLYGTSSQMSMYRKLGYSCSGSGWYSNNMINVFKLIQEYRKKVNPKVNVFSVQTAGYDNVVIPEYAYRTNIMYGWTGNEAVFAKAMIDQWDEIESRN
jgi:hypothetical protein